MILCKPEKNLGQSIAFIVVFALIGLATAILAVIVPTYKWIFQLLFFFMLVAVIHVMTRYSMTQWIYRLTNESFEVIKVLGNKTTTVCSLALSESKLLISKQAFDAGQCREEAGVIAAKINFCQNITGGCYYYIYNFNGKNQLVKFEPNEAFVQAMNTAIGNIKK